MDNELIPGWIEEVVAVIGLPAAISTIAAFWAVDSRFSWLLSRTTSCCQGKLAATNVENADEALFTKATLVTTRGPTEGPLRPMRLPSLPA